VISVYQNECVGSVRRLEVLVCIVFVLLVCNSLTNRALCKLKFLSREINPKA
jgi:hypothetical protein